MFLFHDVKPMVKPMAHGETHLAWLGAWPLLRWLHGLGRSSAQGAQGAQDQEDGLGTEAEGRQLTSRRPSGIWRGEG